MSTTTPNRDDRDDRPMVPGGNGKRPEPAPSGRPERTQWRKIVMVVNVVLIAGVAIIGLAHVRSEDPSNPATATDPSAGPASTLPSPDAIPSAAATSGAPSQNATGTPVSTPSSPPSSTGTPGSSTGPVEAPHIQPTLRSNFAKGDGWPYGAGFRETGRMAWPLGIVDRVLTHGEPRSADAVSWLEKWMKTDVRTIGARVLFAPNHSGAAAITAWHTSVLDTSGLQQPRTGMRLAVLPGQWRLVAIDADGPSVITSGSYQQVGHSATFNLVRRNSTIWVTDPTGEVIRVDDPRIGLFSGPWASWELRDDTAGKRPAGFQEIWAG